MRLVQPAVAAALLWAASAGAQRLDPVVVFVEKIYHFLGETDQFAAPYAPALADLVRRDRAYAKASGEAGALDFMPLCGCQDLDRYHLRGISGAETGGVARVEVTMQIANAPRKVTLHVVRSGGAFLIADVASPGVPSLRALLAREVPREEHALHTKTP